MLPLLQKRFSLYFGILGLSIIAWSLTASATSMVFSNLERMIKISDIIVQGEIISQHTYVSKAMMPGQVVTTTTLKTDRVFFGQKQETYEFTQWGGTLNGKTGEIPGDAKFSEGEKVILFLATPKHENEKGYLFLSLLGQSKYSISKLGEQTIVTRALENLAFVNPENSVYTERKNDVYYYDAFIAELESQIPALKGGQE